MPAIDVDRDTAHEAAQRELAKPIYPKESPMRQFYDWIDRLLDHLVDRGASMVGGWFTITVLLILLAVAIVAAVRVAGRTMRTNRGGDHQLFGPGQLSAAQHRAAAEGLAAQGDWSNAIRHRLRAVARVLEETGVLAPSAGRTANELAHDAGDRLPHLISELHAAATAFNDVTYGERPGTQAAYQMIADLDDHLRSGSPAGAPAVASQSVTVDSWVRVR